MNLVPSFHFKFNITEDAFMLQLNHNYVCVHLKYKNVTRSLMKYLACFTDLAERKIGTWKLLVWF